MKPCHRGGFSFPWLSCALQPCDWHLSRGWGRTKAALVVWAHRGSWQGLISWETCTSLLSLTKQPRFALASPKSSALNLRTPNWCCKKMRCKREGGAGVVLRRGHREAELCPLLNNCSISFNAKPVGVWRHGGPSWCPAVCRLCGDLLKLVGRKGLSKEWHGMHLFSSPCWLLFLAEPDLSQCKRQSWFFPKHKFPYNAWLLQVRNYSS